MKENNYVLILRTILHNRSIERVNLSKITGLSASTVTRCITQLEDIGIIFETTPSEKTGAGRKAINLEINPKSLVTLLVDIGAHKTNYALGFANGEILKLESCKTPNNFQEIIENVNILIKDYPETDVVAFSIPGMVDTDNDTILFVPSRGWKNIKIEIPGKSVYADNEANLAMVAEAFQREDVMKSKCSVFVTIREGFGTGLWINGDIFKGPSFTAGEFGHTLFNFSSGNKCVCGNYGCLEEYVSVSSFFGKSQKDWRIFLTELFVRKDKKIYDYMDTLSQALRNIVNTLNPEYVIIGGELSGLPSEFYKKLEELVKEKVLEHARYILKIIPSTFTYDTYLYGALYAVLEEYFIPQVISKIK